MAQTVESPFAAQHAGEAARHHPDLVGVGDGAEVLLGKRSALAASWLVRSLGSGSSAFARSVTASTNADLKIVLGRRNEERS
ncbi:hypothetical protein QU41_14625 [Bradyrhizobium elkanii]|nr:hypothetical protein QU41_14625 [Bradyrhizobium elkanii]